MSCRSSRKNLIWKKIGASTRLKKEEAQQSVEEVACFESKLTPLKIFENGGLHLSLVVYMASHSICLHFEVLWELKKLKHHHQSLKPIGIRFLQHFVGAVGDVFSTVYPLERREGSWKGFWILEEAFATIQDLIWGSCWDEDGEKFDHHLTLNWCAQWVEKWGLIMWVWTKSQHRIHGIWKWEVKKFFWEHWAAIKPLACSLKYS